MTRFCDGDEFKICDVKIYPFEIKLREPFHIASMVFENAQNVLIQVLTNQGVTGWGEASPAHSITGETQAVCLTAAREIKPLLLGRNPLAIASLVDDITRYLPHHPTTQSAFDMALYDIAAQVAGMPLYRFLGGNRREMETDLTISLYPPEECGERALEIVRQGFSIIKVKLGTTIQDDYHRIQAVRNAVGPDPRIRIDANQAWDRMTAVAALKALAKFTIEFCEQPVRAEDLDGMRFVSEHAPIPVMADESLFTPASALALVKAEAAPYFNVKLSKSGGILNALRTAAIAEAGGIGCMIGCMAESRLGLAAAAHVACASEAIRFFDLDMCLMHAEDPIEGGMSIERGILLLSEEPGLGCVPREETLLQLVSVD